MPGKRDIPLDGDSGGKRPPRRKRYPGSHPRRFEQRYKELDPEKYPQMQLHIRTRSRTPAGTHVPVLFKEVMNCLRPAPGQIVADCTVGYGGHAAGMLQHILPGGRLIGFDVDEVELEKTRRRLLAAFPALAVSLHHMSFAGIGNVLEEEGIDGYDVILADLGVSSMQVDDPRRGMSYKHQGPLDMRMDERIELTAADLLATLSEEKLSAALLELSDEEDNAKIARWIVQQRQVQPIEMTGQLARLVLNAKGFSPRSRRKPWERPGGLHPAAKTFQALRMLVNDELGNLSQLLRVAPYVLRPGGRVGIISFHSGEDRLVKTAFRAGLRSGTYAAISQHVITPSAAEVRSNPRSASAKFRWAKKGIS
jgi:16S rRNA (cytosine1402-N4)-methyltransferase